MSYLLLSYKVYMSQKLEMEAESGLKPRDPHPGNAGVPRLSHLTPGAGCYLTKTPGVCPNLGLLSVK